MKFFTLLYLSALFCLQVSVLQAADNPSLSDCVQCPEMVLIPSGQYLMGSTPEALDRDFLEPDRVTVEQPARQVKIDYSFAISKTEITVDQYAVFVGATDHQSSACLTFNFEEKRWEDTGHDWSNPGFQQSGEFPTVCLSWEDGQAYVEWLSKLSGHTYRLPSEAEWEYAARGGSQSLWPWGDEKDVACLYANASDRSGVAAGVSSAQAGIFECDDGYSHTAPANFGKPNGFGLHGMIGNAGEWQQDCMVRTLDDAPVDGSARLLPGCIERVMRGGSWFNPPMYSRSAFRYGTLQTQAFNLVGIRVVREVPAVAAEPITGPIRESGFVGYVQQQDLLWFEFDRWPGIQVRYLSRDDSSGRLAVYAEFPAGFTAADLPVHPQSIDMVMLEGELQFDENKLTEFDFAFVPPGAKPPVISSTGGASVLLLFDPPLGGEETIAQQQAVGSYVTHFNPDNWEQAKLAKSAGAKVDLRVMHLKQDPFTSARTWYVKLEGGMTVPWEVHSMPEEGFVMEGGYRLAECLPERTVIGDYQTGGYFWRPGGVPHSGPDSGPIGDSVMWLQRSPVALDVVFYGNCKDGVAEASIHPSSPER